MGFDISEEWLAQIQPLDSVSAGPQPTNEIPWRYLVIDGLEFYRFHQVGFARALTLVSRGDSLIVMDSDIPAGVGLLDPPRAMSFLADSADRFTVDDPEGNTPSDPQRDGRILQYRWKKRASRKFVLACCFGFH